MKLKITNDFKKDTRYIYYVFYDEDENKNKTISTVNYYRWDETEKSYVKRNLDVHTFAKGLIDNKYKSFSGHIINDELIDVVETIGYELNDNYWIKSSPNETTKDNLEFLDYAIKYNFASKINKK